MIIVPTVNALHAYMSVHPAVKSCLARTFGLAKVQLNIEMSLFMRFFIAFFCHITVFLGWFCAFSFLNHAISRS